MFYEFLEKLCVSSWHEAALQRALMGINRQEADIDEIKTKLNKVPLIQLMEGLSLFLIQFHLAKQLEDHNDQIQRLQ